MNKRNKINLHSNETQVSNDGPWTWASNSLTFEATKKSRGVTKTQHRHKQISFTKSLYK